MSVAGVVLPTDISTWTKVKLDNCNWKSRGIHATFTTISSKKFKWVSMRETTKKAWDNFRNPA